MLTAMRSMALDIAASGSTPMVTSVGASNSAEKVSPSVFAASRDGTVECARAHRGGMRVRACHAAERASRAVQGDDEDTGGALRTAVQYSSVGYRVDRGRVCGLDGRCGDRTTLGGQ